MGTNYYLKTDVCEHCGRSEKLHVGKSSAGWCFALHVYDDGPSSLAEWRELFAQKDVVIMDEYKNEVSEKDMLEIITDRSFVRNTPRAEEDLKYNSAVEGPRGLLRHRIGSRTRCVGHGEGTWDLLEGENQDAYW